MCLCEYVLSESNTISFKRYFCPPRTTVLRLGCHTQDNAPHLLGRIFEPILQNNGSTQRKWWRSEKSRDISERQSPSLGVFGSCNPRDICKRLKTHRSARFHCCPRCCREYQPGNKFVWWGVLSNLACYGTRSQNKKGGVLSSQPGSNGRWNVENHFSIICSSSRVFVVVVLFRIVHVFTGKNILCYMSKNLTQWKVLDYNAYIPGIYV